MDKTKKAAFIFRSLYLYILWFLLSGKTEVFYLIIGLITSMAIAGISVASSSGPCPYTRIEEIPALIVRSARYAGWLLWRIILAAWHVTEVVLKPRLDIDPAFIEHKTILKNDLEKVIFANSITLTPGTITADLRGDTLIIHQLDEPSAGDITSFVMEKEIARIIQPGVEKK